MLSGKEKTGIRIQATVAIGRKDGFVVKAWIQFLSFASLPLWSWASCLISVALNSPYVKWCLIFLTSHGCNGG